MRLMHRSRVLVIHPYMPAYRAEFFPLLQERLAGEGVDLVVAHGAPQGDIAARGDAVELSGAIALDQRTFKVRGREVTRWKLPDLTAVGLLIVEQALRHPAIYRAALRRPPDCMLAFWGHGHTMTKPTKAWEAQAKTLLTNRGDWFFAYTTGGRESISRRGFPHDRVTVLNNSMATRPPAGPRSAAAAHTAAFVGGLDASKKLEFLLDAAELVRERVPDFRLIVCGRGDQEGLIQRAAQEHPWIEQRGYVDAREKAALATEASILVMPGRVGLVALDSMVLGMPLLTTTYPWHAPEIEYLQGLLLQTPEDERAYADAVVGILTDDARRESMAAKLMSRAPGYSLDAMVDNFAGGVHAALAAGRR